MTFVFADGLFFALSYGHYNLSILFPVPNLWAYAGSNFLLNISNFYKSCCATDFLAKNIPYSKCFLVITGTGSYY